MARSRVEPKVNVTVGIGIDAVNRLDDLAERLRSSRSAVLRDATLIGLDQLEAKHGPRTVEASGAVPFPPKPL